MIGILSFMKQNASLDTSFWINCYRIGLIEEVFTYFNLYVCKEVEKEILTPISKFLVVAEDAIFFKHRLDQGDIKIQNPQKTVKATFHNAEDVAIALAEEMKMILLIDNGLPHEYAKKQGFDVVNSAAFTVFLAFEERINITEAKSKLASLKGLLRESIIGQNIKLLESLGGE
jgi:predicted nucleic acid-binding protein